MVVVIALLVAAMPFVDAFWSRDLGALARDLAEDPAAGEEHLLFQDLLQLATCAPLPPLREPSPLRELVRAEEARRGARATVWDDLLRKDFFRRMPLNPDLRSALRWPDETERWPQEVLLVAEPHWNCPGAKLASDPLPMLKRDSIRSLPPDAAARAVYERVLLRYRQGRLEDAADIDPALVPRSLQLAARFLRLEDGVDPAEGWVALAQEWPEPAIVLRAAEHLFDEGRYAEVAALQLEGTTPMHRHFLVLRAFSLRALGREADALEPLLAALAIGPLPSDYEPLRAQALTLLARRPFDAALLARAGVPMPSALDQVARQAIAAGKLETARLAAAQLAAEPDPRWRGQGIALAGEVAWRERDVERATAAFGRIFDPKEKLGVYRDPSALLLAQALVVREADRVDARAAARLSAQLTQVVSHVHLKSVPQAEALLAAAHRAVVERGEQPVALGEVSVEVTPGLPAAPKIEIDLPEPVSLLAIPAPDGSLRAWFDRGGPP